jgi:hypothetical protein
MDINRRKIRRFSWYDSAIAIVGVAFFCQCAHAQFSIGVSGDGPRNAGRHGAIGAGSLDTENSITAPFAGSISKKYELPLRTVLPTVNLQPPLFPRAKRAGINDNRGQSDAGSLPQCRLS